LCSEYICRDICVFEPSSLSGVEVTQAFSAHCATQYVVSSQSEVCVGCVLSWWRENVGNTALHLAYLC
jgi:hypothetical protein